MKDQKWLDTFIVTGKPKGTLILPTILRQERKRLQSEDEFEMTLLPWQVSKLPNKDFDELSLERQIAYKKLMRDILDVTIPVREKRLQYITEMYLWMANDARWAKVFPGDEGFEYTFAYWCEQLDVDEGYMRRKMKEFLRNATKAAKMEGL